MKNRRRKQFEADMDAELRFHIESYVADLIRAGVSPEEAERRARIEFGAVEASKDECRQAWGLQQRMKCARICGRHFGPFGEVRALPPSQWYR